MTDGPSAVVVGAGVMGAATAWALVRRGWDVTLVEAVQPGHVRASSGGRTRLIRASHGADRTHTRSVIAALDGWRRLEEATGQDLLVRCGLLWFAHRDDGWETQSLAVLHDEGVAAERLEASEVADLYPSVRTDDLAFGLLEPDAGAIRAARAVRALARAVVEGGGRLVTGEAVPAGGGLEIAGERRGADRIVWACGPWLGALFPGLVEVTVTRQEVAFFGAGGEWTSERVPAWVDYDAAGYGVGDVDGDGFKCASDVEGPEVDPDTMDRAPTTTATDRSRALLAHRFPALADAPLVQSRVCQYTLTADTRFIAAPHPEHPSVWLVGGGSGHGFKHGPAWGERVADLLDGTSEPDPAYGLGARSTDVKLRTAGVSA